MGHTNTSSSLVLGRMVTPVQVNSNMHLGMYMVSTARKGPLFVGVQQIQTEECGDRYDSLP